MKERRRHVRQRTCKAGKLVARNGSPLFDCVIRDLSAGGARLSFPHPFLLPLDMDLVIVSDRVRRAVRPVWRRGAELGVSFS